MSELIANERTYCCEVSGQADDSHVGSAVQVDVWLLIEYGYAWKAKALEDNILPRRATRAVAALSAQFEQMGYALRVQFVKQAATELHSPRLYFADGRDGCWRLSRLQLSGYDEFPTLDAGLLVAEEQPGFIPCNENIYLVCTNGQRDVCCARFGRPLYSTLHAAFDARIWQTTHVGGHRHAPNLLCLPSGYIYGHVSPERGVALVEGHDRGELDLNRLRGRSHYAPHVQAGEIFARRSQRVYRQDALTCRDAGMAGALEVEFSGLVCGGVALSSHSIAGQPSACEEHPQPGLVFTERNCQKY